MPTQLKGQMRALPILRPAAAESSREKAAIALTRDRLHSPKSRRWKRNTRSLPVPSELPKALQSKTTGPIHCGWLGCQSPKTRHRDPQNFPC